MIRSVIPVLALALLSCGRQEDKRQESEDPKSQIELSYARGFSIEDLGSAYRLRTFDPTNPDEILQEFTVNHGPPKQGLWNLNGSPAKVAVLSSTYLAYLKALGEEQSISCLSNADLMYDQSIVSLLKEGSITDLGNDESFDLEALIASDVDLALYYDFGPSTAAFAARLEELNINLLRISEYLEMHPLGKAEWIKFFGALFNKMELADSLFEHVKGEYESLVVRKKNLGKSVFTGVPWKGEWYQPGGASFQARFIIDAGGDYLWADDSSVSGMLLDREVIWEKALDADLWINQGSVMSIDEILSADPRFKEFKSLRDGNVFNNNARLNANMGNDYWESGIMNPHLILKDLIRIMQDEGGAVDDLYYYQKLQ